MQIGHSLALTGLRGNSIYAPAQAMLGDVASGFVVDHLNAVVLVRDAAAPANNFLGSIDQAVAAGILVNASPPTKMLFNSSGMLTSGSNLRCQYSTAGVPLGFLPEPQRVRLNTYPNDLSNAAWSKTNMSASFTATGVTGVANSATILTATGANATVTQAITSTSQERITSTYIKRRTGAGTVELTQDNGASWSAVAVTSAWSRVSIASATLANPTVGIRIVTSGDAIDVCAFQHEAGAFITSPIISTETAQETRNADNLYVDLTKIPALGSEFTVLGEAEPCPDTSTSSLNLFSVFNSSTEALVLRNYTAGAGGLQLVNVAGGSSTGVINVNSAVATSRFKFAAAAKTNNFEIVTGGVSRGTDTSGALMSGATALYLGRNGPGGFGQHWAAPIGFLALIPERLSQADMIARTS